MTAARVFGAIVVLIIAAPQGAIAAEWRYCLSSSHENHKIYLSAGFQSSEPMSTVETVFGNVLDQAHLRHDDVQCPRGDDERAIVAMRQQAISFNRTMGNEVVDIAWRP
jgi:hypothetical protein